jgi:predicted transcriptional regulator
MAEVIGIAKEGAPKTQIMHKAKLDLSQLKQYLALLSHYKLLKKCAHAGRDIYKATPKGIEFMEKQWKVINLLKQL